MSAEPSARDVGAVVHLLAAHAWAKNLPDGEAPSWSYIPIDARLTEQGFDRRTIDYARTLFASAWPRVQSLMPTVPISAETEIACTLGQLVAHVDPEAEETAALLEPDGFESDFGALSYETVTALPDVVSWLGDVVSIDDYKTKSSRSGRLPRVDRKDAIDWQGALYLQIAKASLRCPVAGFTHVRIERVPFDQVGTREPDVDRNPVPIPPLLRREAVRLVIQAVRNERSAKKAKRTPIALGLANGACFGRFRDYPCDFVDLCMETV